MQYQQIVFKFGANRHYNISILRGTCHKILISGEIRLFVLSPTKTVNFDSWAIIQDISYTLVMSVTLVIMRALLFFTSSTVQTQQNFF